MDAARLEKLLDIGRQLGEERKLSGLLQLAMRLILDFMQAEYGYLALRDPDGTLEFQVGMNKEGNYLPEPSEPDTRAIFSQVVKRGKPSLQERKNHSMICVPLTARGAIIGALSVGNHSADPEPDPNDLKLMEYLAAQVAVSVDNAQVYTQLQSELAERTRSEEALQEAQDELVAQQRMVAVFEERQRLARDLHDSVNQSIHSLVLFAETLLSTLEKNKPERAREIAERLQESARQALKETRLMLYELQPHAPGRSVDFLQDLEARLATVERRAGVRADVILDGSLADCPRLWQENLFWITIEALNNSLKHAGARRLKVMIRSEPQHMGIEVRDDGRGFDPSSSSTGGLGLRNMQERAELLGGELTILSSPGKGTTVRFAADHGGETWIR